VRIEVRFCDELAQARRGGCAFSLSLHDGATVTDALAHLGVPREGLRALLCNGESLVEAGEAIVDRPMRDGDHLVVSAKPGDQGGSLTAIVAALRRLSALLNPLAHTR